MPIQIAQPAMLYVLSWFVVVSLLILWSLAAWALHAMALWTVTNAGALSGAASGVGTLSLPGWLSSLVHPEMMQAMTQWVTALGPWVDSLLQAAPALAGGLTMVTWVVWGLGSALLVLLGAGLHLLVALWRGRDGGGGPKSGPSLAAG